MSNISASTSPVTPSLVDSITKTTGTSNSFGKLVEKQEVDDTIANVFYACAHIVLCGQESLFY